NRVVKRDIKDQLKRVLEFKTAPAEELQKEFRLATKKLDKAAAKGVIHPNMAARKKAQLARLVRQKSADPAAPAKNCLGSFNCQPVASVPSSGPSHPHRGSGRFCLCDSLSPFLPPPQRERRHQDRPDHERIQQDTERERETNLHQRP